MAKGVKIRQVRIQQAAVMGHIINRWNGTIMGSFTMICTQHSLSRKKDGDCWVVSGPPDRIQKFVELMHFAGLPYDVQ